MGRADRRPSLYRTWMPLVLVVSASIGTAIALWPYWQPTRDRDFIEGTRAPLQGDSWRERPGPYLAVVRTGYPFTAFSATVELEMPRNLKEPSGSVAMFCSEPALAANAVAVHDGDSTMPLPQRFHQCEIIPRHVHVLGLTANALFDTGLLAAFGWMLIMAASRPPMAQRDQCRCGYSLQGLPDDAPCPECGAPRIMASPCSSASC